MTASALHQPRQPAFLFDLDGTLVDSAAGILAALRLGFKAVGRELPASTELRRLIGPPITKIAAALNPDLTALETAEIERAYRAAYDLEGWRATVLFPGADTALRQLAEAGHRIFLVTNKLHRPATSILDALAIAPYFTEVVTPDSRPQRYRSKVEMVGHLVGRYRLGAEQSIFIGDTLEDGEAAARNGIHFVHAAFGYGTAPKQAASFTRFDQLLELADALLRSGLTPAVAR